jgi:hypothetical protein
LGTQYDRELIAFTKSIDQRLNQRVHLPLDLEVRPNRLVRSLVGHLLAHGLDLYRSGEFFSDMSSYFLDESAVLPPEYRAYFWLYPYNDQFVSQVMVRLEGLGAAHFLNSVIKFYPIAFALIRDGPDEKEWGIVRIDQYLSSRIDDVVTLSLPLSGLPRRRWPETPGPDGAVMHTTLSLGAFRL